MCVPHHVRTSHLCDLNRPEIAGLIEEKGTIKVGKNAELVIINGNPDEDIDVMRNLPRYVIFRETVIDNTIAEGFRKKEQ